ncbi:putative pectate lyase 15, partial [Drosera capensis]
DWGVTPWVNRPREEQIFKLDPQTQVTTPCGLNVNFMLVSPPPRFLLFLSFLVAVVLSPPLPSIAADFAAVAPRSHLDSMSLFGSFNIDDLFMHGNETKGLHPTGAESAKERFSSILEFKKSLKFKQRSLILSFLSEQNMAFLFLLPLLATSFIQQSKFQDPEKVVQQVNQCRQGYFHVVNNDYTHWEMHTIGGSPSPTINSQGNSKQNSVIVDEVCKNEASTGVNYVGFFEVTKREWPKENAWRKWNWRSDGDLMLNGAFFVQSGDKAETIYSRASSFIAKPASEVRFTYKDSRRPQLHSRMASLIIFSSIF